MVEPVTDAQLEAADFIFAVVSTHGAPRGTWSYTSPFGCSGKGYVSKADAMNAARPIYQYEKQRARAYFPDA